jgi:hypothetical protein
VVVVHPLTSSATKSLNVRVGVFTSASGRGPLGREENRSRLMVAYPHCEIPGVVLRPCQGDPATCAYAKQAEHECGDRQRSCGAGPFVRQDQ